LFVGRKYNLKRNASLPPILTVFYCSSFHSQQLQEKTTKKNKGGKNATKSTGCSSCCKWTLGIFVLLGAIAGLLTYDTNIHGGKFEGELSIDKPFEIVLNLCL
jgi:TMEM214, C-terminal, caspase 4 activator